MDISDDYKHAIVEELGRVAPLLRDPNVEPLSKMYYFSAIHGIINRVINFDYDPGLTFLFNVLQLAHQAVTTRVNALANRQEIGIQLPPNYFNLLGDTIADLAERIEANQSVYDVLERLSVLTYVTTGNGYYLYEKGTLTL